MDYFNNSDVLKMISSTSQIKNSDAFIAAANSVFSSMLPETLRGYYKTLSALHLEGIEAAQKSYLKSLGINTDIFGLYDNLKRTAEQFQSISGISTVPMQISVESLAKVLSPYSLNQMPNVIENMTKALGLLPQYYDRTLTPEESDFELPAEEACELKEDIEAIVSDICEDRNWQISLDQKIESWKRKNPIYARVLSHFIDNIINYLIDIIITAVFCVALSGYSMAKAAVMRSSPSAKSEVATIIPQGGQIILISSDDKYYYKVYYSDPEGKEYEGYVSKRTVNRSASPSNATHSTPH